MAKRDLSKEWRPLYDAKADQPALVEVPEIACLAIDGRGHPSTSQAYMDAIGALFSVSYTLKFTIKASDLEFDYTVMPLESLWWTDEGPILDAKNAGDWRWTALIAQPPEVTAEMVKGASGDAGAKKDLPALPLLRLERLVEGPSAQILHVGPYDEELPTIEKLHAFIAEQGGTPEGKHHEIYLSDPHRTSPERMKTILRQPARF